MRKRTKKKSGGRIAVLLVLICAVIAVVTIQEIKAGSDSAKTGQSANESPGQNENAAAGSSDSTTTGEPVQSGTDEPTKTGQEEPPADDQQPADANQTPAKPPVSDSTNDDDSIVVVAQPESVTALINKHFALPEDYEPADLVYPDVPFTFSEKIEKRKIRQVAADALVQLFAGAKEDGVPLAGVSAYRSYSRQKTLFDNYVREDGLEKARTYSAVPGTSEHQTGLAIDVTGKDGKCAASDCFAGTPEAKWLAEHADEYGFIIRYPEGKEDITGYKYEPWHIRYVGKEIAKVVASEDLTLEQYMDKYGDGAVLVTGQ